MEDQIKFFQGGLLNFSKIHPFTFEEPSIHSEIDDIEIQIDNDSSRTTPNLIWGREKEKSKSSLILTVPSDLKKIPKLCIEKTFISPAKQDYTNKIVFQQSSLTKTYRDERKSSSILKVLLSNTMSFGRKVSYCLNNFVTMHIIVILLTVGKIILQNYVYKNCWMKEICSCYTDFQARVFSTFSFIFIFLNIVIISITKTSIEINFASTNIRVMFSLIYYCICFVFSFTYLLIIDQMNAMPIYIFLIIVSLLFQLKTLYDLKFVFIPWMKHMLKTNIFSILILIHYFLCTRTFPQLNNFLKERFDQRLSQNLIKLYEFLYFRVCQFLFIKLLHIYSNFLLTCKHNDYSVTIILIRFCSVFFVAVPVSGIIAMKDFDEWGGWLLILSYGIFVFSYYTRIDLTVKLLSKILSILQRCIFKHKKTDKIQKIANENDVLSSHLISGCLIDLIFIINSRLLILMITRRWFTYPVIEEFYQDCGYVLSEVFSINIFGAFSIIGINIFISFGLLFYMLYKKQLLLDYKAPQNYIFNLYYLFMLHGVFEGCIQMTYRQQT